MTDLIEVKTADLVGAPLDWAVAMAEGYKQDTENHLTIISPRGVFTSVSIRGAAEGFGFRPSTNWDQGGPLIEKHMVSLHCPQHDGDFWAAWITDNDKDVAQGAEQALPAACRAIVAAKLGDTVQVPKELMP